LPFLLLRKCSTALHRPFCFAGYEAVKNAHSTIRFSLNKKLNRTRGVYMMKSFRNAAGLYALAAFLFLVLGSAAMAQTETTKVSGTVVAVQPPYLLVKLSTGAVHF